MPDSATRDGWWERKLKSNLFDPYAIISWIYTLLFFKVSKRKNRDGFIVCATQIYSRVTYYKKSDKIRKQMLLERHIR